MKIDCPNLRQHWFRRSAGMIFIVASRSKFNCRNSHRDKRLMPGRCFLFDRAANLGTACAILHDHNRNGGWKWECKQKLSKMFTLDRSDSRTSSLMHDWSRSLPAEALTRVSCD